ncbi:putative ribonuclease H-like domain-containing protein [Tanacetum coccineum]|uniref:Ribonuclease H-like domain-containing protein n=1 Tax=Tanacetum coccineum TaxID=301880 RepID=A0ABQ4X4Z0_9ASTR
MRVIENGYEKESGASNKENDQNVQDFRAELDNLLVQQKEGYANNTNRDSTVSPSVSTVGQNFTNADDLPTDPLIPDLEDIGIFSGAYDDEDVGAEPDLNNLEITMNVRGLLELTWVYRNKKVESGFVVRNKGMDWLLKVTPQEDGIWYIDYDEVFAPVARIEAIRLFLAYASFMGFIVYQMDVKSAFLYGTIEEEVYVCQPPGFEDPQFPGKVYKVYVDDIIFRSTKNSLCVKFEQMMHKKFQMSSMGELTFFLGLSMIGSLMYLTASRPDIMFAVCTCAMFQATPKVSHLNDVKRIFRNLKGQPKLGLWYPKDSPFDLEAFSDSDYAGTSLDRKSTTGGCQFLGKRLISWQCKKQTIVANSTTEVEYVAAANYCGQVIWIQNQMLDYGYNFMNTKIHIDNKSTICIMKNPVFHSKTKHIEIRHHFIRDSYEKKLIQVIKIYTDHNIIDLLKKAFNVSRFNFLIASIGLLNL